jgi:hypothetical protein
MQRSFTELCLIKRVTEDILIEAMSNYGKLMEAKRPSAKELSKYNVTKDLLNVMLKSYFLELRF